MQNIIAFLGLLSALMIFINIKQANKFNIYLGFFFLSMSSFTLGAKMISLTTNYYIISFFFPILFCILLLSGPMLYFYTLSILDRHKRNVIYYLHYLPIILVLIDLLPFFLKSREYKEEFFRLVQLSFLNVYKIEVLLFEIQYFFLFRFVTGVFYALWCLIITYQSRDYFKKNTKFRFFSQYYWLLYLSGFLLINFFILFFSILYIKYFSSEKVLSITDVPGTVFTSSIYGFGIILSLLLMPSILFNPSVIFYENSTDSKSKKKNRLKDFKNNSLEESLVPLDNQNKSDPINASNFAQIAEKLALYFSGKPYLQPGFNLSTISNQTDIPYHSVSSYFTLYLGIPFNDWKNDLRVEHAVELIRHGVAKKQTIESIAFTCGFLSRSNFVNSFKKKMGLTPSEYIKTLPEGDLVVPLNF